MGGPEDAKGGGGRSDEEPDFPVESVEFTADLPAATQRTLIKNEAASARRGAVIGGLAILAGIVLLVLGVSGAVDISFQDGQAGGHVITGSLGIVVVLVGGTIIWATRHRVKVTASG